MRKDITIAKVPWSLRDVLKVIVFSIAIPFALFLIIIGLSHFGVFPESIRQTIRNNDLVMDTIFTVISLLIEVGLLYWLLRKYKAKLSDLGLRKFTIWKGILYVLSGLVVFSGLVVVAFVLVSVFFPSIDVNQAQDVGFEFGRSGAGLWVSFFVTVVCAPIIEELYFRGLLLSSLTKRFGWLAGIIGSSALFAFLHGQANVIIYTFILGCVLSVFYIRLKSIIPGVALHMINNALAFIVLAGLIK